MYFLALKMIFNQRNITLSVIISIALSSFLLLFVLSIFFALINLVINPINDQKNIDIWVMKNTKGYYFEKTKAVLSDKTLNSIQNISGVGYAFPLFVNYGKIITKDGYVANCIFNGVDQRSFLGAPEILEGDIQRTKLENNIFIDSSLKEVITYKPNKYLYTPDNKEKILYLNGIKANVVGYTKQKKRFLKLLNITTSMKNIRHFFKFKKNRYNYILVNVKDQKKIPEVIEMIKQKTNFDAFTSWQMKKKNFDYWAFNSGLIYNFIFIVIIGLLAGVCFSAQSFFQFLERNKKHFAAFLAFGLKPQKLKKMIFLQVFSITVLGICGGIILTLAFCKLLGDKIDTDINMMSIVAVAILNIFVVALVLWHRISKTTRVDPAITMQA